MKSIPALTSDLEAAIDQRDLSVVLDLIADICGEKAEHLRTDWQDHLAAKRWDKAASMIGKLVAKLPEMH